MLKTLIFIFNTTTFILNNYLYLKIKDRSELR